MIVYCYLCGYAVKVEPNVTGVLVDQERQTLRITFAEKFMVHTCPMKPPQDRET